MAIALLNLACAVSLLGSGCLSQEQMRPVPVMAKGAFSGLYEWYGKNELTLPETPAHSYRRFVWKELEPSEGQYDFSQIEEALRKARASHQRFGFRVMACWSEMGAVVPNYLVRSMPNGFWFSSSASSDKPDTYVPDWNSTHFLSRARSLLSALGKRFDGDPAIGWVDIGLYGNWGEWHTAGFPYRQRPQASPATLASKKSIIDAHFAAFPKTRLLMMTDDPEGLGYALSLSPGIGMRRDSLGDKWFAEGMEADMRVSELVGERWKTAPFVTEFYAPSPPNMLSVAKEQVVRYHVAMVGNGNTTKKFGEMPFEDQALLTHIHALAGPNFLIGHPKIKPSFEIGAVTVDFDISNRGNVPAYDSWDARCLLRRIDGEVITSISTALDLRKLLPDHDPRSVHVVLNLKSPLPAGDYEVLLIAQDPSGYLTNQPIGNRVDRSTRGALLGTFQI